MRESYSSLQFFTPAAAPGKSTERAEVSVGKQIYSTMYSNLSDLIQGDKIKVLKEFKDFDNETISVGSERTFNEYTYFPYDGRYTFYFEEGTMRMVEISSGEDSYVLSHANEYFVLIVGKITDTWTK